MFGVLDCHSADWQLPVTLLAQPAGPLCCLQRTCSPHHVALTLTYWCLLMMVVRSVHKSMATRSSKVRSPLDKSACGNGKQGPGNSGDGRATDLEGVEL